MITIKHEGSFNSIEKILNKALKRDYLNIISEYADKGVAELKKATPSDSGKTANSWGYEIIDKKGIVTVYFTNDNIENGLNIAILLIYGHGTKNGSYVQGNDFVTPVINRVFKDLADKMWREVTE
ncbi:MAG: HK97 gp10 family phage protein [Clostridiales bacterium]|nr:HK97 gp10 family phage protein [Clostridiales bacterium]